MRAMVFRDKQLMIDEEARRPEPGPMQVLARVRACGVCGSDLHAVQYAEGRVPSIEGVIMGHEFVAEVVAAGTGAESWQPGTRVLSSPSMPTSTEGAAGATNLFLTPGTETIGYSARFPGGFGEYVLMSAPLLVRVPEHIPDAVAATTEPCAVGLHAVRRARMQPGEHALVMGAGPIGLMTALWLKKEGVPHVTVSDFAAPRRELAATVGADLALDPATDDIVARITAAAGGRPPVVFDCVGVEGTIQQAIDAVAWEGRVIVVGVCSTDDRFRPRVAIMKQLSIQFVLAYTIGEISDALAAIADGSIDSAPLVTRTVTLDDLPSAFLSLNDPKDCKVVVTYGG